MRGTVQIIASETQGRALGEALPADAASGADCDAGGDHGGGGQSVSRSVAERNLALLKEELEELEAAGKRSQEITLLALLETVLMLLVEKSTLKSPVNSSLPGSLMRPGQTAQSKPRAAGPERQHEHRECASTRHAETLQVSPVEQCQHCHHDWTRGRVLSHERRTLVYVAFVDEAHHADAEIKRCPACGKTARGGLSGASARTPAVRCGRDRVLDQPAHLADGAVAQERTAAQVDDGQTGIRSDPDRVGDASVPCPQGMGTGGRQTAAADAGPACRRDLATH